MCLEIVYCDKNGGFELSCRSKYIHNQSTDLPEFAEKILERTAFSYHKPISNDRDLFAANQAR